MNYGYFDDANREYVITNPHTPTRWINYLGTLAFGGLVDHTGGLLICKGDPGLNRITKYIPQLPAGSFQGATVYLRAPLDAGGYRIITPLYVPGLGHLDHFECRVGMGYSRITTEIDGLRSVITLFVPLDGARVLQDIQITNTGSAPRTLDCIPVVEYSHFEAMKQFDNADWVPQTMQSRALRDDAGADSGSAHTVLVQAAFMNWGMRENYLAASRPATSFETDRARFLGRHEYGTWANPLALHAPQLSSYEARRGDNIGALLIPLGTLAPGATARVITQVGQEPQVTAALDTIRRYRDPAAVDAAFESLTATWRDYLDTIQVETPNPAMNSMLNIHHPRQCHTTFNWSRYLSLYQLGLGRRGIGFRDSSQDVMGVLAHMPADAKELLVKLLSVQQRDGSAMHQFFPLSMVGSSGEAGEDPDRPGYYSDDHLWAVLAVCAYLKETGDSAFLDEIVPFYEKDRAGQPLEAAPVLDHLLRAVAFTKHDVGMHGLPLAGFADWNDTVNLLTGGESVFTAMLYGAALRELAALLRHLGDDDRAAVCDADHAAMAACVNQHAWDGAWYRRYFDRDGQPLGSQHNRYGQIYTNAQSWAVLAGFAPPERARQALDAVRDRLNTANGIKLSVPGYNGFDPAVGGVSTYPPGAKENGGIFLHANPWVIIAETQLGRGDRAFEYYHQINPAAKNAIIDTYEIEPYAYAQNILGDEHPQFGLGRNSWLSGTASWVYQAATQYILGVRPTYDGLLIDPCIPQDWDGFRMVRHFRGARVTITVTNPDAVSKGVATMLIDGAPVRGRVVPVFTDGGEHTVDVILGAQAAEQSVP